jgi:hypothetical protein
MTSEVSSEVPSHLVHLIVESAPAEVDTLIMFSHAFKSFNKSLTPEVTKAAMVVKAAFGVRQGCQGRTLLVEGEEMEWKKFVKKYFDITPRRFNQIMDLKDDEAHAKEDRPTTAEDIPPADEEVDQQFGRLEARIAELEEELKDARAALNDEYDAKVHLIGELKQQKSPRAVQAVLTEIIEALDLGGYLRVEIDEVQ